MILTALLGWPVSHSLSPRLHGYWLRHHRIDGLYLPLPVTPADFTTAVQGLACVGLRGANVTIPHKQAAFGVCRTVSPFARRAGAVNTLVFEDSRTIAGSNTDGDGFLASLAAQGFGPAHGPALIVGAGGAARAIAAALLDAGCPATLTARRPEQAQALATDLPELQTLPWPADRHLARFGLLVNASAGGMAGHPPLALDLSAASDRLIVADIVYTPRLTPLLAAAAARGLRRVEGIDMLLHQAALSFQAWFGLLPAVDAPLRAFMLS